MMVTSELRAVMVGSFLSLAALFYGPGKSITGEAEFNLQEGDQYCPWCDDNAIATWNHCAWECKGRTLNVKKPENPIQARLAWPMSDNHKYNEDVCSLAASVVRRTWDYRFEIQGQRDRRGEPLGYTTAHQNTLSKGEKRSFFN